MRFSTFSAVLFAAVSLVAAGCASRRVEETARLLDPYIGDNLSAVVEQIGPPSGNFASDDGRMLFQWDGFGKGRSAVPNCRLLIAALPTYGDPSSTPAADWPNWIVKSWSAYGDGCR